MIQLGLFTTQRIDSTIQILREYCPEEGYYLAFSGGKDSVCLKYLADMAGVKYEAHFHRTTVDPPEMVKFIRENFSDVICDRPSTSMFKLIIEMGCPPTRTMRYCCRVLKEEHGAGRVVLTGVRKSEGRTRHGHKIVHACPSKGKVIVNPMLEWSNEDVWGFIHDQQIPYCDLYDEGWKRIGCIGCPCAYWKTRLKEFERWPKFYKAYLRCFEKMLAKREKKGLESDWQSAQEVMNWWLESDRWTGEYKDWTPQGR